MPLDAQGMTWLVRQYRFPLKEFSWEIPEGGGDPKINPLESAKRELIEETGIIAKKWTLLRRIHLSNSVSDEEGFVYLTKTKVVYASPEETEVLQVKKFSIQEAWEMVSSGEIKDSSFNSDWSRLKFVGARAQIFCSLKRLFRSIILN